MLKAIALLAAFGLVACTEAPGTFPPLSKRPIESRSDAEPAPPAADTAPDPALDKEIATLTAALDANKAAFDAGAAKAETAARVPGAQSVGSDAWVGVQAAIAEIDTLRGDTLGQLVDLEKLATDRGDNGMQPYAPLDAARARAQSQLDGQVAKIAAIKASIGEK